MCRHTREQRSRVHPRLAPAFIKHLLVPSVSPWAAPLHSEEQPESCPWPPDPTGLPLVGPHPRGPTLSPAHTCLSTSRWLFPLTRTSLSTACVVVPHPIHGMPPVPLPRPTLITPLLYAEHRPHLRCQALTVPCALPGPTQAKMFVLFRLFLLYSLCPE